MKVAAISDIHGNIQELTIPEADLLLIAGDLVPLSIQSYFSQSHKWFINKFKPWLEKQPVDKIIIIAGNHDFALEDEDSKKNILSDLVTDKIIYLENSQYVYKDKLIYGTPICKIFGDWAFMRNEKEAKELYANIPENTDILLTHDAPYGVSDVLLQKSCPWADGTHIGNVQLREAILDKQPKYNIHGHLHSTNHDEELLGSTKVYNVSVKDEAYVIKYKPLIFEI